MVKFPDVAVAEWRVVATAAGAEDELRLRIARATLVEREVEKLRIRHEASLAFQQETEALNTPELEMMTLTEYKNNPDLTPADLIDGVMKENGLTIMLGPSGSGKSTLALQMLYSLMTGSEWLGQKVTQIQGSVGVVSYDMDGSLVFDWMAGYPGIDPDQVSVVNAFRRGNPLASPAHRQHIVDAWKHKNVKAILIDSFSASFVGDQNDVGASMDHYRDLQAFAREVGVQALIVVVHSTISKPNVARGSSAHQDVADTITSVVADRVTGVRTVKSEKYRGSRGDTGMSPVIVGSPDTITNLIDVDAPKMLMAGMDVPPGFAGVQFPDLPEAGEEPDLSPDEFDIEGDDEK